MPLPPSITSAPPPPISVSLPAPPISASFASPPVMLSANPEPDHTLDPGQPVACGNVAAAGRSIERHDNPCC